MGRRKRRTLGKKEREKLAELEAVYESLFAQALETPGDEELHREMRNVRIRIITLTGE